LSRSGRSGGAEAGRVDLHDLERRHAEHRAYTYTVLDPEGAECLGCVYVFPVTAAFLVRSAVTPIAGDAWADVEAAVYFWVRRSRMETGMDERLLAALRAWFAGEWGFARTVYVTNERFAQQAALLRGTGLSPRFEVREPGKPGAYVAFG